MPDTASASPRQEVRAFWTGPSLSLYEQLSLRSFLASGAHVQLFSYDDDLLVPEGVELVNANEILPGPVYAFRHAAGDLSLALHSDLFRYVAIEKFGGWYVDADIVFIGRELPASPVYIARETESMINGAVMKFPAHDPLLIKAIDEARRLLPETSASSSHEARLLIGPSLVTRLLHEFSRDRMIRPRSSAYEIGYDEIPALFDPASCERLLERLVDSDFVHLWNEVWRWVRIPKNYGPPEGSFLDSQFRRVGMKISPQARLSHEAITNWFREHRVLEDIKHRIGQDRIPADAMDRLTGWFLEISGLHRNAAVRVPETPKRAVAAIATAAAPRVVQTFWHGDTMSPYQLLCLRSFVDRGHHVEVFSYNRRLRLPGWLERRDAAEIAPEDKVLRRVDERLVVHGNLFRYALLVLRGGWWIDPDVILLKADLPEDETFFSGPDVFGFTSTALLKFPKGSPIVKGGLDRTLALGDSVAEWDASGAPLLTDLLRQSGFESAFRSRGPLGPVSWFDVPALFDPSRRDHIEMLCRSAQALQLHTDVWLRAGIPQRIGPPEGSILAEFFANITGVTAGFGDFMEFDEANRWIRHMYESVAIRHKDERAR